MNKAPSVCDDRNIMGVASIFSVGVHFLLDQKSDDLFLVITLSYMVIYVIYCHQVPLYLICGGAPHQIQPQFCLIPAKNAYKKLFLCRPGECTSTLCTPWLRLEIACRGIVSWRTVYVLKWHLRQARSTILLPGLVHVIHVLCIISRHWYRHMCMFDCIQ